MNILYISYDGMTDPLGQSQVIPYLKGLSNKGFRITILSCEKEEKLKTNEEIVRQILDSSSIIWKYISYTKSPPVFSTLYDILRLKRRAFHLQKKNNYHIIHCRSYISAIIGLSMKRKFGCRFLFDMRGFWADERVEGKIWNIENPVFRIIYHYFKRKEKEFLEEADHIISLTEAGKEILHKRKDIKHQPLPVTVIPCCVDIHHFIRQADEVILQKRLELRIGENDLVLSYLGSIGTWYMLDEMLLFYKRLLNVYPNAWFMFITTDTETIIKEKCHKLNIASERIIVRSASRQEVPVLMSLSDISIFFIKPVFSKKASSPTKQAEVLSLGIPIVCNSNIGDTDEIIKKSGAGVIVDDFNNEGYDKAIQKVPDLIALNKNKIINFAKAEFSLEKGVEEYYKVYMKFKP